MQQEYVDKVQEYKKTCIGKVPIMLKSNFCMLTSYTTDRDLALLGECTFDEVSVQSKNAVPILLPVAVQQFCACSGREFVFDLVCIHL